MTTHPPSVVLFELTDANNTVPVGGRLAVDLDSSASLDQESLQELLDASIQLDEEIDPELRRALRDRPIPTLLAAIPQLHEHRALVFRDGRCVAGDHVLRYQPQIGLTVETIDDQNRTVSAEPGSEPYAAPSTPEVRRSFDVVTQPWIPVVALDGTTRHVGLFELFTQAHLIRRIVGETPPMTSALHRLAIAFGHRVYGPISEQAWAQLWQTNTFPAEPLTTYHKTLAPRFDLFDAQRPFLQCADLASMTPASPAKLISHRAVGNNVTLFDHTTAADRVMLTPAEAARWLVTTLAYDPGGMKTPYRSDKSSERAPCSHFGAVLVEGDTLKATLLLNTVVYQPDHEKPRMTTPGDCPAWEEDAGPSPYPASRTARGWTDLLTWPSRRILLFPGDEGTVDGVVVAPGTRVQVSEPDEELMAAFRRPLTPRGKPKWDAPMLPIRLHPLRGIWRHSVELLLVDLWNENRTRQRPGTLDHIAELAERGSLPADTVYTLRVFGQQLDSKASVVEAWLEEEIPAPVPLLRARDESLGALIGHAITLADDTGRALRHLQDDYRRELRAAPVSTIDVSYWPKLNRPFAAFLTEVAAARQTGRSETKPAGTWNTAVRHVANDAAARWITGVSTTERQLKTLGKHHGRFRSELAKLGKVFHSAVQNYSIGTDVDDD